MTTTRLLDRRAVEAMTGLSRSTIYAAMTRRPVPEVDPHRHVRRPLA